MRQIGDDVRYNPFNAITMQFIGNAQPSYLDKVHHRTYFKNKVNDRSLKFCAQ